MALVKRKNTDKEKKMGTMVMLNIKKNEQYNKTTNKMLLMLGLFKFCN